MVSTDAVSISTLPCVLFCICTYFIYKCSFIFLAWLFCFCQRQKSGAGVFGHTPDGCVCSCVLCVAVCSRVCVAPLLLYCFVERAGICMAC